MPGDPMAELQAMLSGGGGSPPMASGGAPPMGGAPPAMGQGIAGGGDIMSMLAPFIQQFLGKMANNPQAMASIGGALSEMAGPQNDPRMRMAGSSSGPPMPMPGGPPPMPTTEDEMAAVNANMGAETEAPEWQGTKAPTQDDVDMLLSDPEAYAASFNAKFGEGTADAYLDKDGPDEEPDGDDDDY